MEAHHSMAIKFFQCLLSLLSHTFNISFIFLYVTILKNCLSLNYYSNWPWWLSGHVSNSSIDILLGPKFESYSTESYEHTLTPVADSLPWSAAEGRMDQATRHSPEQGSLPHLVRHPPKELKSEETRKKGKMITIK